MSSLIESVPDPGPRAPGELSGPRARVLLVDDHPANLVALEAVLGPLGHDLVGVSSGADALAHLERGDVALVLLDVQMPSMDGFQTAREMRRLLERTTRRVPIVFLTSIDADRARVATGYASGAVDFIQKPFDADILRAKVSIFVELHLAEQRLVVERQRATERLQALAELALGLSEARTRAQVTGVVVEHGMRLARADTCTLYLLDPSGEALELLGDRGVAPEVIDKIRRITETSGNPATFASVRTGTAIWAENASEYAAIFPTVARLKASERRAEAFWSVPLVVDGRAIGLLGMGFYDARAFSSEERAFVGTFGKQCAQALHRALLLEREDEARRWLSTTLRSIGDAVLATDTEGRVTFMNPVAEHLTGWSEAEARGRALDKVFPIFSESTREPVESPVTKVLREGAVVGLANHTFLRSKSGVEVAIDDSGAPIRDEGGRLLGVVLAFRDVTNEKREAARREFLSAAGEALVSSLDFRRTLATVARLAVPRLADWCAVEMADADGVAQQLAVAHVDPTKIEFARQLRERYPPDPHAATGVPQVIRSGNAELYPAIPAELLEVAAQDAEHLRIIRELRLESAMIVPLRAHDRTFGAMTFIYAGSGRRYTEADLTFASDFARRAAMAIENARALKEAEDAREAERRARHRIGRMQEITAALSRALSAAEVAGAACAIGAKAIEALSGALWLLRGDGSLVLAGASGPHETLLEEFRVIAADAKGVPALEVIRTREPIWVETEDDYLRSSPEILAKAKQAGHVVSYSAVPLSFDGPVQGVIVFAHRLGHRYDPDERAFYIALAHHCSQALHRARLLDTERQSNERLRLLASAGETLARSLDLDETLQAVARLAVPAFCDWCVIDLVEGTEIRRIATVHSDAAMARAAHEAARRHPPHVGDSSGVATVIADGTTRFHPRVSPATLRDAARDPESLAFVQQSNVVSSVVLPLMVSTTCIGAISFTTAESERVYSEDDLRFAAELARRAGLAISNARLYRAAQDAAQRAEEANRLKDEFLATVSHELRTPLNVINGWSALLTGASSDAASVAKGLAVIRRNAQAQKKIIEDILDVSRIVTGKLKIESAPVDMVALIRDALDVVRPSADARQLTLTFETLAGASCHLLGDSTRLQQVLWNLLSNAVKFTNPGGSVTASLEQDGSSVTVVVTDSGSGIEAEFLPHVFERFRQADSSSTRKYGGLGLGLAIVRHIVELHGGRVSAESAGPGTGATFTVVLPVRSGPAHGAAIGPAEPTDEQGSQRRSPRVESLSGLRILVVDDEDDARDLVGTILADAGAVVDTCSSARDALEALDRFRPEVIVSDIGMPSEDGLAFIRQVRARTQSAGGAVPALALTAYARSEDRLRALAAGYRAYLSKPVDPAELVATVRSLGDAGRS